MKAALTGESTFGEGMKEQWQRMTGSSGSESGSGRSSRYVDPAVNDSFPASDPPASHLPDEPPANAEARWAAARGES